MTVWCLTLFSKLSQLYRGGQFILSMIPGASFTGVHTITFPSHWQLFHVAIVETIDSGERGMNPVAMSIINPRKELVENQTPYVK